MMTAAPAVPGDALLDVARRRRVDRWDVIGVLALTVVVAWARLTLVYTIPTVMGRGRALLWLTVLITLVAVVAIVGVALTSRTAPSALPAALTRVWRDPPGYWVAAVLGGVLSLVVVAMYHPMLFLDSDSARLIASVRYVQQTGRLSYFVETQEPYLPHLVYGPAVAMESLVAVKLTALACVSAFVASVSYIAYRMSSSLLAAAAAAVVLLDLTPLYERSGATPMYPTMLMMGVLGSWLCGRAMAEGTSWRQIALAGTLIGLAPEAHSTGQLLLAVPALTMLFAPTLRRALHTTLRIYVVVAAVSMPRIVINLWEGGLNSFFIYRSDFWVTQGYLTEIQRTFFHYEGVFEPTETYLGRLPGRILETMATPAWPALAVAAVALLLCLRRRAQIFTGAALLFFVLAVTVKKIPPFARYYALIWPGVALVAAVGVAALAKRSARQLRVAAAVTLVLMLAVPPAVRNGLRTAELRRSNPWLQPIDRLAAAVNDDRGVLGFRAQQALMSVRIDVDTYGSQFLSEEELVTYLTWPSDAAVIELMSRYDLGWILLVPSRQFEEDYHNVWLVPNYGLQARLVDAVASSPEFCRRFFEADWALYELGPCDP